MESPPDGLVRRASSLNFSRDLCRAVTRGQVESVRVLLEEQRVSPNLRHRNLPALNFACTIGIRPKSAAAEIIALLVKNGADLKALVGSDNILHAASALKDAQLLQIVVDAIIVSAAKINGNDNDDKKSLLREMVNQRGFQSMTPLHSACRIRGNVDSVRVLLSTGVCDVNAKTGAGISPLHEACWALDAEIVVLLLQHGADANASFTKGAHLTTPMSIMAEHADALVESTDEDVAEIKKLLKKAGAIADADEETSPGSQKNQQSSDDDDTELSTEQQQPPKSKAASAAIASASNKKAKKEAEGGRAGKKK